MRWGRCGRRFRRISRTRARMRVGWFWNGVGGPGGRTLRCALRCEQRERDDGGRNQPRMHGRERSKKNEAKASLRGEPHNPIAETFASAGRPQSSAPLHLDLTCNPTSGPLPAVISRHLNRTQASTLHRNPLFSGTVAPAPTRIPALRRSTRRPGDEPTNRPARRCRPAVYPD